MDSGTSELSIIPSLALSPVYILLHYLALVDYHRAFSPCINQSANLNAMRFSDIIFPPSLAIAIVSAGVVNRSADSTLQDGRDAQGLNQQFQGLTVSSKCIPGETKCVNGHLAQCVSDKFMQLAR